MLSPSERHALEKAALDDPFLADALEGYGVPGVQKDADLIELKARLAKRTGEKVIPLAKGGKSSFLWWRAAALLVLVAGGALLVYRIGVNSGNNEIAQAPAKTQAEKPKADSQAKESPGASTETYISDSTREVDSYKMTSRLKSDSPAVSPTENDSQGSARRYFNTSDSIPISSIDNKLVQGDTSASVAISGKVSMAPPAASAKQPEFDKEKSVARAQQFSLEELRKQRPSTGNRMDRIDNFGNNFIFRGRVTDNSNNPLPFANISNVEDNVGTYADAKGYFNLTSPDTTLNVQIRSLGFTDKVIQLSARTPSNKVVLQEDDKLDEIVISKKKPNATSRAQDANMKLEGEPEPEDGWDSYDSYLANNINMPEDFVPLSIGGKEVRLSFEVSKSGAPINIKVEKSLCVRCDQEAIRLITTGPKWKRKAKKGRAVVTVTF